MCLVGDVCFAYDQGRLLWCVFYWWLLSQLLWCVLDVCVLLVIVMCFVGDHDVFCWWSWCVLQVIMPGYCVAGTIGWKILNGHKKIEFENRQTVSIVSCAHFVSCYHNFCWIKWLNILSFRYAFHFMVLSKQHDAGVVRLVMCANRCFEDFSNNKSWDFFTKGSWIFRW